MESFLNDIQFSLTIESFFIKEIFYGILELYLLVTLKYDL